ncbi:hypothetical protein EJD97_006584 [Solanum chilense]|uniref:Uncharacterized protein n=1 Tax=Solanum chilense TaxID=4083 RepID=A0A6N2BXZ3_SOLCI|nr:hypothetical protein EJD97_006584 [Solanum chilense]
MAVRANWMYRKGLEGCPYKFLAFFTSESGSPKKWFAIAHKNHPNREFARFWASSTLKMGLTGREGQADA